MRNLWLFLARYKSFFLFLIFESVALWLLITYNHYQRASAFNASNYFIGQLYKSASNVNRYLYLNTINDSLAVENTRLRNRLKHDLYIDKATAKTRTDTIIGDSLKQKIVRYTYINAKVVENTTTYRNNFLVLDKGSKHGVKTGMGVISDNSIVGIVKDVSEHFCTVMSLLHKDIRISARLERTREIGSLVWNGGNIRTATLTEVPNHVIIKPGDWIVTSGFSLFPEGIRIGRASRAQANEHLLSIDLVLLTNFSRIDYVDIVLDKLVNEQKQLEQTFSYDKTIRD